MSEISWATRPCSSASFRSAAARPERYWANRASKAERVVSSNCRSEKLPSIARRSIPVSFRSCRAAITRWETPEDQPGKPKGQTHPYDHPPS